MSDLLEWVRLRGKVRNQIDRNAKSLQRYFAVIKWIVTDSVLRFRRKSIFAVSSGIAGVILQMVALAIAVIYVNLLESSSTIRWFDYTILPRTSIWLLFIFFVVILAVLLLSSTLIYYSRKEIIRLRIAYEKFCVHRIVSMVKQGNAFSSSHAVTKFDITNFLKLINIDSNYCGKALQTLLNIIRPLLTLILAFIVLLYMDWKLTLSLIALTMIFFMLQYKIGLAAASYSTLMEQFAPKNSQEKKNLLLELKMSQDGKNDMWLEEKLNTDTIKKYYSAYEFRLSSVEKSSLIGNIFFAICVAFILFYLVGSAILYDRDWAGILLILLALRYGLVSLNQFSRTTTSLNQLYPQFNRYRKSVTLLAGCKTVHEVIQAIIEISGDKNSGMEGTADESFV